MSLIGRRLTQGLRAVGRMLGAVPGGAGRVVQVVRGRYDASLTTDDNRRHWALADGLSANTAASPEVRRILRNRSRYEIANNSYARGISLTLANDCIGTGPRLQLLGLTSEDSRQVERAFLDWSRTVGLAEKLRCLRIAMVEDGEGFALLTANPALASPVQLDLRLIEADQIATPNLSFAATTSNAIDGIRFDAYGNPAEYHLLRKHPGDDGALTLDFVRVPAANMLHIFRPDRPGQLRGVPEITPAIPLFAQLRRFTLAVLAAAETAADLAGILYTDAPANGEADEVSPMDRIELEKRSLTTVPSGWKMAQMHAEQPATTYADFKHEVLNEIARCLNVPYNVAAGNSSSYNYASGRLDHQVYFRAIRIDQSRFAALILDRLLAAWLREALLINGFLPPGVRSPDADWSHQWFWDGQEHVDPQKEATAQATRLANHTTTLADEFAKRGQDWEGQLQQRARELTLMRTLGLTTAEAAPPAKEPAAPADGGEE